MSNTDFAAFEALDLTPIKMKLMHVESGEGWTSMRAGAVEAEYRRFLFLMKKYPDAGAAPTVDVDTFWHYHILDTMKYARDCDAAFGYFLHHYPYVGIGADADEGDHTRAGDRMREIYQAEFGGMPARLAAAYCAAPGGLAAAYCAAPGQQAAAYCSAPGQHAAYCTGPGKQADAAWCASPGKQQDAAWCGSPGEQASAWCASPGKQSTAGTALSTAWCASPGKQLATMIDSSAWCASPGKKLAANAWCASPAKPAGERAKAANSADAWCASPGKQLPLAA